jgi:hypothetical protein
MDFSKFILINGDETVKTCRILGWTEIRKLRTESALRQGLDSVLTSDGIRTSPAFPSCLSKNAIHYPPPTFDIPHLTVGSRQSSQVTVLEPALILLPVFPKCNLVPTTNIRQSTQSRGTELAPGHRLPIWWELTTQDQMLAQVWYYFLKALQNWRHSSKSSTHPKVSATGTIAFAILTIRTE